MTEPFAQIPLELDYRPALTKTDYLVSRSNRRLVEHLLDWRRWPAARMVLVGPPRSGKTHLAHVWMQETGARLVEARALDAGQAVALVSASAVVVENVDRLHLSSDRAAAEEALFHIHNALGERRAPLLLTGSSAPGRWALDLPDLASRVQAMPVARLEAPDDALLSSILVKLFADRQVQVGADVVRSLSLRMERSIAEAERLVDALDRQSLSRGHPVTRAMAIALFERE